MPKYDEIPRGFVCPITQDIMTNPVMVCETGQSYEKEAIEKWFETQVGKTFTDPSTNRAVSAAGPNQPPLIANNVALKQAIEDWKEKQEQKTKEVSTNKRMSDNQKLGKRPLKAPPLSLVGGPGLFAPPAPALNLLASLNVIEILESSNRPSMMVTFIDLFEELKNRQTMSLTPDNSLKVQEYLLDFFKCCAPLPLPAIAENMYIDKDQWVVFKKFFGGKGIQQSFELLIEIYSLNYFHSKLSRKESLGLLNLGRAHPRDRGQFLLRYSTSNMMEGCLALDALRTDEDSTYTALVSFEVAQRGWKVGDGKDTSGNPKTYLKLKYIHEANSNVLTNPIQSDLTARFDDNIRLKLLQSLQPADMDIAPVGFSSSIAM